MFFRSDNLVMPVPDRIVVAMCWIFVILFGIWLQPHTVFIRHSCQVIGALLGLYIISKSYRCLFQVNAAPLLMLVLLVFWALVHLIFFSQNYDLQVHEFARSWKKIALIIPFGVGLGIALSSQAENCNNTVRYWKIIYLGLLMPSLVYFIKLTATTYFPYIFGVVPKYLYLSSDHLGDSWGVSRAAYVFFCMPAFAVSMTMVIQFFRKSSFSISKDWMYVLGLILPPCIFFMENDRTGVLYCILISALSFVLSIREIWGRISPKKMFAIFLLAMILIAIVWGGLHRNGQWKTLISDAKLAVQIEKYDNWKHIKNEASQPFVNDMGVLVSESNYDRIAWLIRGLYLVEKNPLGYGLMTLSFGHLNVIDFPGTQTSLSHSAWLDFTLGYGFPGLILLLGAALLAWRNARDIPPPWSNFSSWILGYWVLLFFTKELSMEIFINAFVLIVAWFSAMSLRRVES